MANGHIGPALRPELPDTGDMNFIHVITIEGFMNIITMYSVYLKFIYEYRSSSTIRICVIFHSKLDLYSHTRGFKLISQPAG